MPLPEVVMIAPVSGARRPRFTISGALRCRTPSNGSRAFWGLLAAWLVTSVASAGYWLESGAARRGATARIPGPAPELRLSGR